MRILLALMMMMLSVPSMYYKSAARAYFSFKRILATSSREKIPSYNVFPPYLTSSSLYSTSMKDEVTPSGVVAVYKPIGWTSSDVVNKLKWIIINGEKEKLGITKDTKYKTKTKIGHGGTLDPLAEGVLVIGVGKGTKQLQGYLSGDKGYRAVAVLGCEMDTQDCTGNVTETMDCSHLRHEDIKQHIDTFRGKIEQIPPMFSALKKDGKRLYDLARNGMEVERKARQVMVHDLEYLPRELPEFGLEVTCGGGVYIRTLIVDLARAVGGRAHMKNLLRTKQGIFTLEDCIHQDKWNYQEICGGIHRCSERKK